LMLLLPSMTPIPLVAHELQCCAADHRSRRCPGLGGSAMA
jgi:hypothetical protein